MLSKPLYLSQVEFDYENVYEWCEAIDVDGVSWNISRKHDGNGQPSFRDYLVITPTPLPANVNLIGQKLANTLKITICFGEGFFGDEDVWQCAEQKQFIPIP